MFLIAMFGSIGPEFQCLEGEKENSNVYKDRARIPMKRKYDDSRITTKHKSRILILTQL